MPVEKTERDVITLMGEIARGEIRLPEIQRGYVWKPTQVAKLVDSLYHGYPTGSLLFWRTADQPRVRRFAGEDDPPKPVIQPLYLLDGQQRLTALHRVLADHPDAQVVFNVESSTFQNQSAATARDPRYVKVCDVARPGAKLYEMIGRLHGAIPNIDEDEIARRLQRLAAIRDHRYHMEVLVDFPYDEVAQIFVRVNSGGRALKTADLALATLSARWPGVLGKIEKEASHWAEKQYGDLDVPFLTRALTAAVLGRGLSTWSHARLVAASDDDLESGWRTVERGLRHLIPLLKNNLKIRSSSLLPSLIVLLPLIVFLGERPDEPLDEETANGLLYWLLVATIHNRYSGATDTLLGQDIPAARAKAPVRKLLANLGVIGSRVEVTTRDLAGRSVNSPYFFLSFLVCQNSNAHDWWYGTAISLDAAGDQKLEYHHIHPKATLRDHASGYTKSEINDLANLAFISGKANRKISDRSPAEYFPTLNSDELKRHFVPLDEHLRNAEEYRHFLVERRGLLATAMTVLLDTFRPPWLDDEIVVESDPLAGSTLDFTVYESKWDRGRVIIRAEHSGIAWVATASLHDLKRVLSDAEAGIEGDIEIGSEGVPVSLDGDDVKIRVGPFLVAGTVDAWRKVIDDASAEARPISQLPQIDAAPWKGDPTQFPLTKFSGD